MSKSFDTRLTHALLTAILILQTLDSPRSLIGGDIVRALHGPFLITLCFVWAFFGPRLMAWMPGKPKE